MSAVQFSMLAAAIFALVALLQIVRAIMRSPVTIGQTSIPVSVSWIAFVVAIILAWLGYSAAHA
jgi:hypothetical protein